MNDMAIDRATVLISDLVPPELVPLYLNNVIFHDSIQRLAHSLPSWVEALAAEAQAKETEQQAHYLQLLRGELSRLDMLPFTDGMVGLTKRYQSAQNDR